MLLNVVIHKNLILTCTFGTQSFLSSYLQKVTHFIYIVLPADFGAQLSNVPHDCHISAMSKTLKWETSGLVLDKHTHFA